MNAGHLHVRESLYNEPRHDEGREDSKPGARDAGRRPHFVAGSGPTRIWDERGPIRDLAMDRNPVRLAPRSRLETSGGRASPRDKRASWYESMGIMVVWEAYNDQGPARTPFHPKSTRRAPLTPTSKLPGNNDHGGGRSTSRQTSKVQGPAG